MKRFLEILRLHKIFLLPALCLVAGVLFSCSKEEEKSAFAAQEKRINAFVEDSLNAHPEYKVIKNKHITKLIVKEGIGEPANGKSEIAIFYIAYTFPSKAPSLNNLLSTNIKEIAERANWTIEQDENTFGVKTIIPDKDELVQGLKEGLEGVKEGEECYILFSGKYGYGSNKIGIIPTCSALMYHIFVEAVK